MPQKEACGLLCGVNHSCIPEKLMVTAFKMVSHADGRSCILLNAAHTLSIHTGMFYSPGEDSYMDGTLHIKVLQEIQPSRLYRQE